LADSTVYGIYLEGENFVALNTAYSNGTGATTPTNMNRPGSCSFGLNHAP
jgi:hypothetical protein